MNIAEKTQAVAKRMAEEDRPAAWLAFLLFVLKADDGGRYKLKSTGSNLLCRLADKLNMMGVWPSIAELMTGQQLTKNGQILSALPEVSIDLEQTQKDLRAIAHKIASCGIETDGQGRTHLDAIGRVLTEISKAIESPSQS